MNQAPVVELVLHPRNPRGKIRSLRLASGGVRAFKAGLGLVGLLWLGGLLAAPRAISIQLVEREYATRVARRQQLGERLVALVGRLEELDRRGADLAARLERVQRVYGLAGLREPPAVFPYAAAEAPASIFGATIALGTRREAELRARLAGADAAIEEIARFERTHPEVVDSTPARSPLGSAESVAVSAFGVRRSPYTRAMEFHTGLDLAAPIGTPIAAPADGVVVFASAVEADRRSGWWRLGRTVVLRHGDLFRTLFGHCSEILVRPGQRVRAGDVIARVGDTGWTLAPQLHYEVRRREGGEWRAVDPRDYLLDRAGGDEPTPRANLPGPEPEPEPLPRAFLR